jgi:imidazolonepropionase-like amidohydrolase
MLKSRNLSAESHLRGIGVLCCLVLMTWFGNADVVGQERPTNGLRDLTPEVHALTNARIIPRPGSVIEQGTVVLRNGRIEAVGTDVTIPADARVWDCAGATIYPGLIEMSSTVLQQPNGDKDNNGGAVLWNSHVRSDRKIADELASTPKMVSALRDLGFTVAVTAPTDGVLRGASAVVSLGAGTINRNLVQESFAQHVAFQRGKGEDEYPVSLQGMVALIRQTFSDAGWYRDALVAYANSQGNLRRPDAQEALSALAPAIRRDMPVFFTASDEGDVFRARDIATEFDLSAILIGSGSEYRWLEETVTTGLPVVLPLNFPEAPDVSTADHESAVTLRALQHWELAPRNPALLEAAGLTLALTSAKLKKPAEFPAAVRKAVEYGLSEDAVLAALTTTPATLLKMEEHYGTIEPGKAANLVVTRGRLFGEDTQVLETWIDGRRYPVDMSESPDCRGDWEGTLALGGKERSLKMTVMGPASKLKAKVTINKKDSKVQRIWIDGGVLYIIVEGEAAGEPDPLRLSGRIAGEEISGNGLSPEGHTAHWQAERTKQPEISFEPLTQKSLPEAVISQPLGAYGKLNQPDQPDNLLVRDVTIWTSGPQGRLEHADLLVRNGRIDKVGVGLSAPAGAVVIDGKGRHVTPGIIDCHSHICIHRGVNESTHINTAEVRIGDVLDPDDITMYRQMAGGVTSGLLLHGSANAIGGQNQVIKYRWGASADALKFDSAMPTIKFALGENVKQSNWGDPENPRYPDTRMGVEQAIREGLQAAVDYRKARQEAQSRSALPPRRDLQLETLVDVLEGKIIVHCHTYRQDETLMMMRVAEDFGIRIGVFVHALEGYKVATEMAEHGVGATTFSDWWAYKMEAFDAIPYNAALMYEAGVLTSINSDDAEMGRRLNLEAVKAVKYGGVSEEEAFKFITLNPAKQLKMDHRVGSLESGKDADFVIWSGSPMSALSRCEQTWIDGRKYFDVDEADAKQQQITDERRRLIQKILQAKSAGENGNGKSNGRGGRQ